MAYILQIPSFPGSNVYYIQSEYPVIIDTGHSPTYDVISSVLKFFKIDLRSIKHILLTHSHPDHTGATENLKVLTGASIGGFKPEYNPKLTYSLRKELDLLSPPVSLDQTFDDNSILDLGNDSIQVVQTPGHTDDHLCYFLKSKRILFTGDLIIDSDIGYLNPNRYFSESLLQLEKSVQLCQAFHPELLLPGHGNLIQVSDRLWNSIYRRIWLFKKNPLLIISHTLISTLIFYLVKKSVVSNNECEEFIISYSFLFNNFVENTTKDLILSELKKLIAILILKNIIIKHGEMLSLNKSWAHSESSWIV